MELTFQPPLLPVPPRVFHRWRTTSKWVDALICEQCGYQVYTALTNDDPDHCIAVIQEWHLDCYTRTQSNIYQLMGDGPIETYSV